MPPLDKNTLVDASLNGVTVRGRTGYAILVGHRVWEYPFRPLGGKKYTRLKREDITPVHWSEFKIEYLLSIRGMFSGDREAGKDGDILKEEQQARLNLHTEPEAAIEWTENAPNTWTSETVGKFIGHVTKEDWAYYFEIHKQHKEIGVRYLECPSVFPSPAEAMQACEAILVPMKRGLEAKT